MTHPNKVRGNNLEYEVVAAAKRRGFASKRAYASDGRSLGMHEQVDCVVEDWKIQCKRRKSIASYLIPTAHVDAVVTRKERSKPLIIMPLEKWLDMLDEIEELKAAVYEDGYPDLPEPWV